MQDVSILNGDWLLLGRQVRTAFDKLIDLLAIDYASREDYHQLYRQMGDDEENAEFLVPVRWLHTVSRDQAFSEVGLFGNQNTVCKPTTPQWSHTVERLKLGRDHRRTRGLYFAYPSRAGAWRPRYG